MENYVDLLEEKDLTTLLGQSFKKGVELSLLNGTTAVAQLSKESKYFDVLNETPLKTYLFFELFSDSIETSKDEFRSIRKKIDKLKREENKE